MLHDSRLEPLMDLVLVSITAIVDLRLLRRVEVAVWSQSLLSAAILFMLFLVVMVVVTILGILFFGLLLDFILLLVAMTRLLERVDLILLFFFLDLLFKSGLLLGTLDKDLLDVSLDLRSQEIGQLNVQIVLDCELSSKFIGLITFEYLNVFLLTTTDIDGDGEELGLSHIGRAVFSPDFLVSIIILLPL